jgi:hypothetical protein
MNGYQFKKINPCVKKEIYVMCWGLIGRGDMVSYLKEERETIIITDDVDKRWRLYTRQLTVINKMKKIGIKPVKKEIENQKIIYAEYVLEPKQITIRKLMKITENDKTERKDRINGLKSKITS